MNELLQQQPAGGWVTCFSIICVYIRDGGIKGLSSKQNGLEQLLEWFILPAPANSALSCWRESCWQQPFIPEDAGKRPDGRIGAGEKQRSSHVIEKCSGLIDQKGWAALLEYLRLLCA